MDGGIILIAALSVVCGVLGLAVAYYRDRAHSAEQVAEWNAALATKAKAAMSQCVTGMRETGDRLEATILRCPRS